MSLILFFLFFLFFYKAMPDYFEISSWHGLCLIIFQNVLNDLKATLEGLEEEMAQYHRKKELEAKLLLLQQKQQWYLVSERRISANEERQKRDDQMLHVQDLETKMAPKVKSWSELKLLSCKSDILFLFFQSTFNYQILSNMKWMKAVGFSPKYNCLF